MRTSLVILCIFVVLLAVGFNRVYQRLFNVPIPEGFPTNSTWQFKLVGFSFGLAKDLGYLGSLLGVGDDYYSNIASLLACVSGLNKNNSYSDKLEINDTEIFGVGVRIYKPVNQTDEPMGEESEEVLLPGLIYFHGGGWTIGTLDAYDDFCCRLAVSAQVIVVSADYRQAPRHIYPTQFNDCYNVAVGLLNTGATYGVDVSRVIIAGDSAGGNLVAAVSHFLASVAEKHCRRQYIIGQILLYPPLQFLDFDLPSFKKYASSDILSQEDHASFVSLYLTGSIDLTQVLLSGNHSAHLQGTKYMSYLHEDATEETPKVDDTQTELEPRVELSPLVSEALTEFKASPLMADDFRGIPPTLVITAEFDVLRDDGFRYSERLRKGGVDVVYKNYLSFHGFVTAATEGGPARTDEGDEAFADIVQYIKDRTTVEEPL